MNFIDQAIIDTLLHMSGSKTNAVSRELFNSMNVNELAHIKYRLLEMTKI